MELPPDMLVNGRHYSHLDSEVRKLGVPLKGCKEWNYKVSVERGSVNGTARQALGFTLGGVKYEASLTIFRAWWSAWKDEMVARGLKPLDVQGVIVITLSPKGLPPKKVEITIAGLKEQDNGSSSGPDPHEIKITYDVLDIKEDGKSMIDGAIY